MAALTLLAPRAEARAGVVGLYDVFETAVSNTKPYANPFDFHVIELRATFTAPSGREVPFFGFYDGDGKGGQSGPVWKLRFMPDETGAWGYRYTWSDGTPGGSGRFTVRDTGLPGPLKVDPRHPWYFVDSRGKPFHLRGYSLHHFVQQTPTRTLTRELAAFRKVLRTRVVERRYNFIMGNGMNVRVSAEGEEAWMAESWWLNAADTRRFNIPVWRAYEETLRLCQQQRVYVVPFATMVHQQSHYDLQEFAVFLRYFVARLAPYGNFFGWTPTWEWMDIWTPAQVNQIMQSVHDWDPWKRLLTAHDNSHSTFARWLGFSMRQCPSRDLLQGHERRAGQQQVQDPAGRGGIGDPFVDRPILGSEDLWETPIADHWKGWTMPRDRTETRRAAWGLLLGGVLPLYDEWSVWQDRPPGKGAGEADVRRMLDFVYSQTRYREYRPLWASVSHTDRQACSGVPDAEYLVYSEVGEAIILDLSSVPASTAFAVLWYDPANGKRRPGALIRGGSRQTLASPFREDTVLLLRARTKRTGSAAR